MRGLIHTKVCGRHTTLLLKIGGIGPALAITVLFICILIAAPVRAQEDEFQAESGATYTFGQNMRFSLRAKSADDIRSATLFFNTPEMDGTLTVDFELDPAREIELEHELSLTQVQLAPFTTVRYWWRLNTEAGSLMVDEQTLSYIDDRFQWQETVRDGIVVHWTGADSTLGQVALDVIESARPEMQVILPVAVEPIRVFIYPSMADLRSALRLTGRDWLGADAMPELDVLLVTAVNPRTAAFDLGQSIPHELSHLMLYRVTGAQYDAVPRWFDEGLATNFETTQDATYLQLLELAVATQDTIPIKQLCATFPEADAEVRLAYAQSASWVRYIQQKYGTEVLGALVRAYTDGASCESGLQRVLGLSSDEFEREWLAHEKPVPPLTRFLRANGLWVALAGGGFLIMGLLLMPLRRER